MEKEINIITSPQGGKYVCFPRPFKTEKAAIRKARKVGSDTIIFEPESYFFEACWYVVRPKEG